jgi:hypothetical protein
VTDEKKCCQGKEKCAPGERHRKIQCFNNVNGGVAEEKDCKNAGAVKPPDELNTERGENKFNDKRNCTKEWKRNCKTPTCNECGPAKWVQHCDVECIETEDENVPVPNERCENDPLLKGKKPAEGQQIISKSDYKARNLNEICEDGCRPDWKEDEWGPYSKCECSTVERESARKVTCTAFDKDNKSAKGIDYSDKEGKCTKPMPKRRRSKKTTDCSVKEWKEGGAEYKFRATGWMPWVTPSSCGPVNRTRKMNYTCVRVENCNKDKYDVTELHLKIELLFRNHVQITRWLNRIGAKVTEEQVKNAEIKAKDLFDEKKVKEIYDKLNIDNEIQGKIDIKISEIKKAAKGPAVDVQEEDCQGLDKDPLTPASDKDKEGRAVESSDKDDKGRAVTDYSDCTYSWCVGEWSAWDESKKGCKKYNKTRTRDVTCCRSDNVPAPECKCTNETTHRKCRSAGMASVPSWALVLGAIGGIAAALGL